MVKHVQLKPSKVIQAIIQAINLGSILQQEHPEIASLYRSGKSTKEICEILFVQNAYRISETTARKSVYRAITGYDGEGNLSGVSSYPGLIPDKEERKALGIAHMKNNGVKQDKIARESSRAIYGMSKQELSKAGLKSGNAAYQQKKGIHAFTSEQRKSISRTRMIALTTDESKELSLKGILAMGRVPWSDGEAAEAYLLTQRPDYQWLDGYSKGRPNNHKIAQELNRKYHGGKGIRTSSRVGVKMCSYKKSLEGKVS